MMIEYNRVGFLNKKLIVLIIVFNACLLFINGINWIFFFSVFLLMSTFKLHIPYRSKIKQILKQIDLNTSVSIYHNRIKQFDKEISCEHGLRSSEIEWLCTKILFMSHKLKHCESVYTDNENIGENFHVNIV